MKSYRIALVVSACSFLLLAGCSISGPDDGTVNALHACNALDERLGIKVAATFAERAAQLDPKWRDLAGDMSELNQVVADIYGKVSTKAGGVTDEELKTMDSYNDRVDLKCNALKSNFPDWTPNN